jgi:hypothetical protein
MNANQISEEFETSDSERNCLKSSRRLMSRRSLMALAAMPLLAQLKKVLPATLAAHLTGRLSGTPNGDMEIFGYLNYVEGIGGNLFAGTPSEGTAMISFRTEMCRLNVIPNGNALHVSRQIPPDGGPNRTSIYYNAAPARDFAAPDTFSDGQVLAVLRSRSFQGVLVPGQMFLVEGSMDLESSSELMIGGLAVDLKSIGRLITVTFAGVAPSAGEFASASSISIPLGGTIVAARASKS